MMVGIVDADLLASGTRHPNLALLKIAGFLHDNDVMNCWICSTRGCPRNKNSPVDAGLFRTCA